MSTVTVCDGCQKPAETQSRGICIKRDYCPGCMVAVDAYLAARDELQERLAATWDVDMAALKVVLLKDLPDAKLPDGD